MSTDLHLIVGLGLTGFSCARYLAARNIPFAMTDSREKPPLLDEFKQMFPAVDLSLGGLDEALLKKATTIIVSPGMPLSNPAITAQLQRGADVIGDIELFARVNQVPVIAITGTNAKSTVTTLVGLMAEAAGHKVKVGGNLGTPVLNLLDELDPADYIVLELSSFQLETTHSLRPRVATILNVTPDHMDRYLDFSAYQQAKHRVYLGCEAAVCNRDDRLTDTVVKNKCYFTLEKPRKGEFGLLNHKGKAYLAYGEELLLAVDELPVLGAHYQANALASLALGHCVGFSLDAMLGVLREFKGLPHRCQFVRNLNQVAWYNDSKGTNVGASQAAIEGLGKEIKGKLILIAGGVGKGADFSSLASSVKQYVRHVVLIGEAAKTIAEALQGCAEISFADSMQRAVSEAARQALPDDAVLLSPACASFDMYNNYEHRGQAFMELVTKLQGE